MKIGLHISRFDLPGGPAKLGTTLGRIAATADEIGFSSLWVMDHLYQLGQEFGAPHGPVEAPMLEGMTTLAYLAALTRRIQLGLLVGCPFFRHPGMLVKAISTLDVLSGGRSAFGIGAGWFEREARGLGVPFPSSNERFERLEETILIARHLWSGSREPFVGRHYRLEEPINSPQPLRMPHPPIVIGGSGEKRTLRLVAQYADVWNFVMGAPSSLPEFAGLHQPLTESLHVLEQKLSVLERHCDELGRPFAKIEKSVVTYVKIGPGASPVAEVVELCGMLAERGVSELILNVIADESITPLETIGRDVIPQVQEL